MIDTGIAGGMPDFRASGSLGRRAWSPTPSPTRTPRTPGDAYGHGTHVAGIIAGNGWNRSYTDPLRGKYVGIAPEANLISVKVSDDQGEASVLDVIYGLQFVVDNKAAYNIRVVNLSLESTTPGSYKTDPLNAAVESAWFKGIVVVTAAGNRGSAADAVSRAPGNDPYVITVGAYDDQASNADGDDSRPAWSSRGITADGFAKPEIHAPGSGIVSTLAPNSQFASMCPSCVVDGQMIRAGGTSMAAPMITRHRRAAAAALPAAQARPGQGHAHAQRAPGQRQVPGGRGLQDARGGLLRADLAGQHDGPDPERDRQRDHGRDRLHALELEPLVLEHGRRRPDRRLRPLELEPLLLELGRLLRRGRHALELEPLELVHQLGQVAGSVIGPGSLTTTLDDVDTRFQMKHLTDMRHGGRSPMNQTPKGRIRWAVAALAIVASAALPATAGASSARSQVIVQLDAGSSADAVKAQVRAYGGRVTGDLPIINGFSAKLSDGAAASLQRFDGVREVTRNAAIKPQGVNVSELQTRLPVVGRRDRGVEQARQQRHRQERRRGRHRHRHRRPDEGLRGEGPEQELARRRLRGHQPLRDQRQGHLRPRHARRGHHRRQRHERGNGDWLQNKYIGVAPEADLVSVKVSDDLGNATVLDVIYGLQWVVDFKSQYNIRVVNLSLESTTPGSYKTDPLDAAVESAWLKGLVVVAAAGNRGTDADAVQYAPGNDPYVISVGALDDQASQADGDDSRATWSSRGVTQDGFAKPEIHAPGARIVSTLAPGSAFSTLCADLHRRRVR